MTSKEEKQLKLTYKAEEIKRKLKLNIELNTENKILLLLLNQLAVSYNISMEELIELQELYKKDFS